MRKWGQKLERKTRLEKKKKVFEMKYNGMLTLLPLTIYKSMNIWILSA